MPITVVQSGRPRQRGKGLRLGTVRRPPRGVRKEDYAICENEERCHRSILRRILSERGAVMA